LGEAGGERGAAFIAAAGMEAAELEGVLAGRKVEVGIEKGVVGDLADGGAGDRALPVPRGAGADAAPEHGERGFELALEDLPQEIRGGGG